MDVFVFLDMETMYFDHIHPVALWFFPLTPTISFLVSAGFPSVLCHMCKYICVCEYVYEYV